MITSINERLDAYAAHPRVFRSWGERLSTALHTYWMDRYGYWETISRLRVHTGHGIRMED